MTLHEAIEEVLREYKRSMKASEIAELINLRQLYSRKDFKSVTGSQISARVSNYPQLFEVLNDGINLYDSRVKPFKDLSVQLSKQLLSIVPGNNDMRSKLVASLLYFAYFDFELRGPWRSNAKEFLLEELHRFQSKNLGLGIYEEVLSFIERSFSSFDAEKIVSLIEHYDLLHFKPTIREFSRLFDAVINGYSSKSNLRDTAFSTPKPINHLMSSLYLLDGETEVFDPFAGRASLLTELIQVQGENIRLVIAGDTNDSSVNIGKLNLSAAGQTHYQYEKSDAFMNWESKLGVDLVISNPPFGTNKDYRHQYNKWNFVNALELPLNAIQLALYHLNSRGKGIIIIPESTLYSSTQSALELKAKLVEDHILDGVILLPKNSFKGAALSTAMVLINNERSSKTNGIFFYDAQNCPIENFDAESKKIVSAFHGNETILQTARWVKKSEIIEKQFDLSVKPYLLPNLDKENLVALDQLIDLHFLGNYVESRNLNLEEGLPYIQIADLNGGEGVNRIDARDIKAYITDTELVNQKLKFIPKGSILLSKVGTKLKATIFDTQVDAVASSNILILIPRQNVLPEYLISQLQSEYVLKQVEVIRRYNGIPNINLKHFLNIKIQSLPIVEQSEFVAKYYSNRISEVETYQARAKEDELFNVISRIKHEVKQPVSSIGMDISVLLNYFKHKVETQETVSFADFAVEPFPGISLKDVESTRINVVFKRIQRSVDDAQETLQKAEETLNLGKGGLKWEDVNIKNYILTTILPLYENQNFIIEVHGKEQKIKIDKYQIKVLFKHLIDNAIKYGFNKIKARVENIIRIDIQPDRHGFVEIQVMNNGSPFNKGFKPDSFTAQGITSDRNNGSGFGGYHIKRVLENHKGLLKIATPEEVALSDFKVNFKLYLPISNG